MKTVKLDLTASQAKTILEAISETEKQWNDICEKSDDEDVISGYGNDLVLLRIVKDEITLKAIEAFGTEIVNFSRS
jgi:hypothetical protein